MRCSSVRFEVLPLSLTNVSGIRAAPEGSARNTQGPGCGGEHLDRSARAASRHLPWARVQGRGHDAGRHAWPGERRAVQPGSPGVRRRRLHRTRQCPESTSVPEPRVGLDRPIDPGERRRRGGLQRRTIHPGRIGRSGASTKGTTAIWCGARTPPATPSSERTATCTSGSIVSRNTSPGCSSARQVRRSTCADLS